MQLIQKLNNLTRKQKLYVSIVYDIFDLILSKVILASVVAFIVVSAGIALPIALFYAAVVFFLYDLLGVYLAVKMYGGIGWWQAWEFIDFTDQIDSFVPTLSLLYYYQYKKGEKTTSLKESKTDKLINYCKGKFKSDKEIEECIKKG